MHRSIPATGRATADPRWYRGAVLYEVYVRSFDEHTGDRAGAGSGVGNLAGIIERLDYLALLGVDGLWLTPFYRSPMADGGYDVADPRDVDPLFGDLATFDRLVEAAHRHGLAVVVDVVPNHTSERHPWFQAALAAGPGSPERARYWFRPGRGPDGSEPPNNWPSVFGGPAWHRVPDGEWYLHLFAPEQPDLNWASPEVAADLEQTLTFWLDRGVDGFRIDVAHGMAKPADLRDLPPEALAPRGRSFDAQAAEPQSAAPPAPATLSGDAQGAADATGIVPASLLHESVDPRWDNDAVHDVHRMIRRLLERYPGRMAVGEAWVRDDERLARYVRPDELHQVFNFRLLEASWDADALRTAITGTLTALAPVGASATWVLSNHDVSRHVTRYGGGEVGVRRARAAALLELALPGSAYLWQGDELGLADVDLPDAALQDPTWERSGHTERGRDGCRVPIPWSGDAPSYGFGAGQQPWLPQPPEWAALTAARQADDPASMLSLYRQLLDLRREHPAVSGDTLEWLGAPPGAFAFRRPDGLICAVNTGTAAVALPAGELLITSVPLEDGALPSDAAAWLL